MLSRAANVKLDHPGRFGRKVFIGMLYDMSKDRAAGLSLGDLKNKLLEAHRAGLIELVRCDMPAAFPPDFVAISEIKDPHGETFHFMIDENYQELWEKNEF